MKLCPELNVPDVCERLYECVNLNIFFISFDLCITLYYSFLCKAEEGVKPKHVQYINVFSWFLFFIAFHWFFIDFSNYMCWILDLFVNTFA